MLLKQRQAQEVKRRALEAKKARAYDRGNYDGAKPAGEAVE